MLKDLLQRKNSTKIMKLLQTIIKLMYMEFWESVVSKRERRTVEAINNEIHLRNK